MEGTMRPIPQQAAGPAVAGILVAALSPSHAVTGVAACHLLAFAILNFLRPGAREPASFPLPDLAGNRGSLSGAEGVGD
jgi:hypothetical protein